MTCNFFKPTYECEQCKDSRCQLKGGTIIPSEMCGCDFCGLQHISGDNEECLKAEELL